MSARGGATNTCARKLTTARNATVGSPVERRIPALIARLQPPHSWPACPTVFLPFRPPCAEFPDDTRRPCFTRVGLSPEQQTAMAPEPGEAGVKCYEGYLPDAKEMPCQDALAHRREVTLPLSQCKDACNTRG